MSNPRLADYLEHVLLAIERIQSFVADISRDQFVSDVRTQDAVIRNLEVIGEASRLIGEQLPPLVSARPKLALRESYRMRNRLAHGYFEINLQMVWETVQSDLPGMAEAIKELLVQLDSDATKSPVDDG